MDYTYRDNFDFVSTIISSCGGTSILNVQSDLRVNNAANPGGSGSVSSDSVRQIYSICVSLINVNFHLIVGWWIFQASMSIDNL